MTRLMAVFFVLSIGFALQAQDRTQDNKNQEIPREQIEEYANEIENGEKATYNSVSVMSYRGLYGLVDYKGIPITSFKYSSISKFSNGFAIVRIDSISDEVFENDLLETYEKFGIIN